VKCRQYDEMIQKLISYDFSQFAPQLDNMAFLDYQILVVDDTPDNVFLLQTLLEAEGYGVETAYDGSAALAKIKASPPDLLLLDVMMPDMNGFEVAERIRQDAKLPHIPIVLITAHDEVAVGRGRDVGANDFIRKPIEFDELLTRVKTFCRQEK